MQYLSNDNYNYAANIIVFFFPGLIDCPYLSPDGTSPQRAETLP